MAYRRRSCSRRENCCRPSTIKRARIPSWTAIACVWWLSGRSIEVELTIDYFAIALDGTMRDHPPISLVQTLPQRAAIVPASQDSAALRGSRARR
jgi:hypothetical protein